jgi:hypothetical protein
MMQTDVLSLHLNNSGTGKAGRCRIKGMAIVGTATAGSVVLWDTTSAPVSATYGRSGTTVTITSASHGLSTGQYVGIDFAVTGGSSATDGNYQITVTDANTFTVTDLNSGTIATSTACTYVVATATNPTTWLTAVDTAAVTSGAQTLFFEIPGEGLVVHAGIYMTMSNLTGVTIYYA